MTGPRTGQVTDIVSAARAIMDLQRSLDAVKREGSLLVFRTVDVSDDVLGEDGYIRVDATAGNVVLSLPDALSVEGQVIEVMKVDASVHTVTLSPTAPDTINGAASYLLAYRWQNVRLVSVGDSWDVLSPTVWG